MKFKKEIATLLLASTLLTASLTACNTMQKGGDDIDNTTTEITTIETTPDTNPSDTAKPNEVIRDVPKLGKLKLVPYSDMQNASIWRAEEGEFFLYISEWDAYRQLSGLSSYHNWFYFTDNCIVIDDKTTTITLIDQVGKHDEPTIITYHFNKDNSLVELHAVPLNIIASSEYDTFFVNMHTADHGYYFLTPSIDGNQDWRMDGVQGWPLFMFETTDGGKSWNQISTNTFTFCTSDHINIIKFVSPNVGIISFRYVNIEDLCERTYLTLDGGLTWNPISQLPYPPDKKWGYSEVVDLALIDGFYYLTVKISDNNQKELQFCSKDLTNWTLEKSLDVSLENYIGTWYTSAIPPDDLTITSVSDGKIECHLRVLQLDAFDDFDLTVTLQDGKYIFTDKNELISGTIQFKEDSILVVVEQSNTDDLQSGDSWSFTIKDTIVRTIYSSSEGDCSGKVVCKYEYSKSGSMVYLQIDAWNQTLVLPFTYEHIVEIKFASLTATIVGDKGFFIYRPGNDGTSIKILSFTKGSDEITEQTITWDEAICQSDIFCNFINDEIGYIFVIEEGGHSGFAHGYQKISKLYKTQDGGKTWTSVNCDNAPYINLRECLILAKFATEDIGIIAGRHWASDYSFHERTYITKDGGLTWIPVDLRDFFERNPDKDWGIQAYDLQYVDGVYYLYVQAVHEGADKPCYLFTSSDGIGWNYLEKVN